MTIPLLLDADVLIDLERERSSATLWFDALPELPYVSGIAAGELLLGCRDAAELRKANLFLSIFEIIWPESEDVRSAAYKLAPYKLSHGLGLLDAMTAAIALRLQLPLATFNAKHFGAVPSLSLSAPYAR